MRQHSIDHKPTLARLIILALGASLIAVGCDRGPDTLAKAAPGRVPAETQRPGDSAAGYDAILNRPVGTCGLPYSVYEAALDDADEAPRLPDRTGRNAALPYSLTAYTTPAGVELVTFNCLTCHAAELNGEIVIGLGNEFLDFTQDTVAAAERAGALIEDPGEVAEWRRWTDRITAIAPYSTTETIGANPAENITLALYAHRDPKTLAWSDTPLIEPPPSPAPPLSVPPWWHMSKKHAMFYDAEGRGDHARLMMLASALCVDAVADAAALDSWFTDVRAFIAALEPPPYPYAIDETLASDGRVIFEDNCKKCHGTYGEGGSYPNRVVPLGKVETDPLIAEQRYSREWDRFRQWLADSFYGERSRVEPSGGYIAPPLDGIWATAPYLHNGSVPTLASLLDSSKRPAYWRFADEREYDEDALGWSYVALNEGKSGAKRAERHLVYDTRVPGYSNQGHTFGDKLTPAERMAVIEYLKTL